MVRRNQDEQTCHDSAVRRSAGHLKSNGWKVKADISGYEKPSKICVDDQCRKPDIVATKKGITKIIEWETSNSYDKDREQHSVFRKYARRHLHTHSSVKICDF